MNPLSISAYVSGTFLIFPDCLPFVSSNKIFPPNINVPNFVWLNFINFVWIKVTNLTNQVGQMWNDFPSKRQIRYP